MVHSTSWPDSHGAPNPEPTADEKADPRVDNGGYRPDARLRDPCHDVSDNNEIGGNE